VREYACAICETLQRPAVMNIVSRAALMRLYVRDAVRSRTVVRPTRAASDSTDLPSLPGNARTPCFHFSLLLLLAS